MAKIYAIVHARALESIKRAVYITMDISRFIPKGYTYSFIRLTFIREILATFLPKVVLSFLFLHEAMLYRFSLFVSF